MWNFLFLFPHFPPFSPVSSSFVTFFRGISFTLCFAVTLVSLFAFGLVHYNVSWSILVAFFSVLLVGCISLPLSSRSNNFFRDNLFSAHCKNPSHGRQSFICLINISWLFKLYCSKEPYNLVPTHFLSSVFFTSIN